MSTTEAGPKSPPVLSAIRVALLQESLRTRADERSGRLPTIVATGRVGSGKSSLGNLMVGSRHLLKVTGHMDCTDRAQVVLFPCGLEYVDLPGVASNDILENLNRWALGIAQVEQWAKPSALPIDRCTADGVSESSEHRSAAGPFADADVVYYMLAAHQQFGFDDKRYLTDLQARHTGTPVLFVLNHFSDAVSGARQATPENVQDMVAAIRSVWSGGLSLVEIDCRTGEGLDELLERTESLLGPELGAPLAEVVGHQQKEAPVRFAQEMRDHISERLAALMPVVPSSELDAAQRLDAELRHIADRVSSGATRDVLAIEIAAQLADLVAGLRVEVTRPIMKTVEHKVYEDVPVYKTVYETDYGKPEYRSEPVYDWQTRYEDVDDVDELLDGVGNLFSGNGFTVARRRKVVVGYRDVLVGYGTSRREVFSHTERRQTRVETGQEQIGVEVVDVAFSPFGAAAAAAGVAVCARAADPDIALRPTIDQVASALANAGAGAEQSLVRAELDELAGPAFDAAVVGTALDGERDDG